LRTLSFNKGDLIILLSQLAWVSYTLYSRANRSRLSPLVIQAGSYVVSLAVLVPLSLLEAPWESLPRASWKAFAAIVYTAVPVTLGHLWYYQAVRTVGASRTAVFMNLMPFAVFGLSWALLGEAIRWYHGVGATLVIAGVALVTRR
jgi:drug/metabolite transporter (DMT)-like permease